MSDPPLSSLGGDVIDAVSRNNVNVSGSGTQPMLFAHGFGCDQNMWRYVAPAFEDAFRVVLFDYVGSGRSDLEAYDPDRYASLDGYADDLLEVIDALDLRDVVLVGHSVSGMVGVVAANREPDRFAHLILIGPSPRYIDDPPYVGGFARADLEALLDMMDRNFIGWANFLAPVVAKNPDRPGPEHTGGRKHLHAPPAPPRRRDTGRTLLKGSGAGCRVPGPRLSSRAGSLRPPDTRCCRYP